MTAFPSCERNKKRVKASENQRTDGKKDKSTMPVEAPILVIRQDESYTKNNSKVFTLKGMVEITFLQEGEKSWSIGKIPLEITIGDPPLTRKETLNFLIVKSDSPYNMLLGRTAMQKIGIVVSTIHGAIKFHTTEGIVSGINSHYQKATTGTLQRKATGPPEGQCIEERSWLRSYVTWEDALSRKNSVILACLKIQPEIIKDLELMKVELVFRGSEGYTASLKIERNLILRIKEAQKEDGELWSIEVGELVIEGPKTVEATNKNKGVIAKKKLKEARSRQKNYADRHQRALEFKTEDIVFLKVSPCKGVRRCDLKGKLSPRFICPFEILDRVGEVSYRLALSPQLSHVHNVFHISLLRGYNYHPLHVISYPLDMISGRFIFC
ncbi:hypothetical protein Tco_0737360 [Tanacetum coccineum]